MRQIETHDEAGFIWSSAGASMWIAEYSVIGDPLGGVPGRSLQERKSQMEVARSLWTRLSKPLAIFLAVCVVGGVTACQTTKGVGRDIENLGDNIEDAAEDAD